MKKNLFLNVVWVLTLIIMLIGTTLAYFTSQASSEKGVDTTATKLDISVIVTPKYNHRDLLPTNDSDIFVAYNNMCRDLNNNGACVAYDINVNNGGSSQSYVGTITFKLNDVTNLNYLVIDDDDQVYVAKTAVISDSIQTLGDSFELSENDSAHFVVVVWVPNYDYSQDDLDAGGNFSAVVTYTTDGGVGVTGVISGA